MESATADRGPRALEPAAPPSMHPVTTSDGTEVRLTHYAMGTKGPLVLAPGLRQRRARVRGRHRARRTTCEYLGEHGYDVWLLDYRASPDLAGEPDAVHGRRHRDARLAGGDRRMSASRPARTRSRRWATASAACRCSWRSAAACEGLRSATFSALAGHPIADRRQPAARRRAPGDDVQDARDQGPQHRLRPRLPARPRGRARDARAARSATSTTAPSAGGSTSSTATSSTSRTSTRRRWTRPCRASSASATSRSSSTSR